LFYKGQTYRRFIDDLLTQALQFEQSGILFDNNYFCDAFYLQLFYRRQLSIGEGWHRRLKRVMIN
jgi:hypothetical protein